MKNLLFVHSSSELYGSDKSLYNLIKGLDKNRYSVNVLLPQYGPLVDEIELITGVNVIVKDFAVLRRKDLNIIGIIKYVIHFSKSISFIKQLINEKNIHLIYTNTSVVFVGAVAAKLAKIKSVWHVREILSNKNERKLVSYIVNKFSDLIVANSKATGSAITSNNNKLRIVYNAIEAPKATCGKNNLVRNDEITIGMAGRINRWKGQKLFVDIASKVLDSNIKVKFVIAGDAYKGEEYLEEELKTYIKEKNLEEHISLLGLVEDMNNFYGMIDIFVLPSIKPEPFGLVILEAMSRSIPVVATNHGGPKEIITHASSGYLVDYDDLDSFSSIIIKLSKDKRLREKIGFNGRINQEQRFSIDTYTYEIDAVLKELLKEQ